jgi:hypothetical protein
MKRFREEVFVRCRNLEEVAAYQKALPNYEYTKIGREIEIELTVEETDKLKELQK